MHVRMRGMQVVMVEEGRVEDAIDGTGQEHTSCPSRRPSPRRILKPIIDHPVAPTPHISLYTPLHTIIELPLSLRDTRQYRRHCLSRIEHDAAPSCRQVPALPTSSAGSRPFLTKRRQGKTDQPTLTSGLAIAYSSLLLRHPRHRTRSQSTGIVKRPDQSSTDALPGTCSSFSPSSAPGSRRNGLIGWRSS